MLVNIDDDTVYKIVVTDLKEVRDYLEQDLGAGNNMFSLNPDEDDAEIQRHLDALDLIIDWYGDD